MNHWQPLLTYFDPSLDIWYSDECQTKISSLGPGYVSALLCNIEVIYIHFFLKSKGRFETLRSNADQTVLWSLLEGYSTLRATKKN